MIRNVDFIRRVREGRETGRGVGCNHIHVSEERVNNEKEEEPKRESRGQLNVVRKSVTEIVTSEQDVKDSKE